MVRDPEDPGTTDLEEHLGGLTPVQRRMVDAAGEIATDPPDRPDFMHTVLAQVGIPRKRTPDLAFERTNGNVSLRVEAGTLWDGRQWVQQPLPYGTRPRLALVHIASEAVRTRSRTIDAGQSTREFLVRLGLNDDGREYGRFQQQMTALAAARMQMGIGGDTYDLRPIRRFRAWFHPTGEQKALWPGTLELTADFYETLLEHAVPLDHRALAALSHSALALDAYTWLCHRLHRIQRKDGVKLSWANLRDQFGQEYRNAKDFKQAMKAALRSAQTVYPEARIEEVAGGVVLLPSPPPVPKTMVPVDKPGEW